MFSYTTGRILYSDNFDRNQSSTDIGISGVWAIEQQPGGKVMISSGQMIIDDRDGCTIWFTRKLHTPIIITYSATVTSKRRVSDLNCFWMATDPHKLNMTSELNNGFGRQGKFKEYDSLRLYYVGYGGNNNTTTRFRRYAGDGSKPLLPKNDLREAKFLLVGDHTYHITLVTAGGRTQFIRDGEVIFDFDDPDPLFEGWFAFRTVDSYIEIGNFSAYEAVPRIN